MKHNFVIGFYFMISMVVFCQDRAAILFDDSTAVRANFINRGTTLLNKLDTLWILNGNSFRMYRTAHQLLFNTKDLNTRLYSTMQERDSLRILLDDERRKSYEDLLQLNRDFRVTTGKYVQQQQDSLFSLRQYVQLVHLKIEEIDTQLQKSRKEMAKAGNRNWWYFLMGALGGTTIALIAR